MKKIFISALALLLVLSLSGCAGFLPGRGNVSGTDVSQSDTAVSPDESDSESMGDTEDELDVVITYRSIAASWETAEDDAAYLAAARERLDEYTLLITSLGTMMPELSERCDSADDVRRDSAYNPLYAALAQWSENVINYDSSALGEQTAPIHEKLLSLAELNEEYIELVPSLCVSSDTTESDGYIDEMLTLMLELDSSI